MGLSAAAAVLPALRPPFSFPCSSASAASTIVGWFGKCRSGSGVGGRRSSGASSAFRAVAAALVDDSKGALSRRGCWNSFLPAKYPASIRNTVRTLFATMSSELSESAGNNPGLQEKPDEATKGYFVQQTMYRIKDPKVSLDFYTRILGMSLLKRFDFPETKFSLYFLGYEDVARAPTDPQERVAWTFGKKATIELTHNWGTESDDNFKGHHNGNSDPRGYGHIGITVNDTYKACERFEKLGVKFVKKPDDGKMKGLAFIQDPDGYWIEIFDVQGMSSITAKS